ncbi:MAG TPA: GGDEF domain-containing protein [Candidatus Aquabacterium excrementipullorum]|nr:GGDEF domain-containing protein [Candidatus Aquabacterium excrementipullorum]
MIPSTMTRGLPRLQFDSPQDERLFDKGSQAARLRYFMISGWVSLLTYNGFLVVDWLVSPDVFALGVLVRLVVFTSFGMATMLIAQIYRHVLLALPSAATEGAIMVTGIMAALSVAVVLTSPNMGHSEWTVFYHGGFVPVIIYGTVVQRLRFRLAAMFTGAILMIHWFCMALAYREATAPVVPMLLFVSSVAIYTLVINYRLEYEERQQFLRQQRGRVLRDQLDRSRIELEKAARCDPLTGVANRRAFDQAMQEAWAQARQQGSHLALLLVDVDHFKAYNDFYGHPSGDQCLHVVAQVLQAVASQHGGLVARWGGEEFAVVLPAQSLAQAQDVAARARQAIQAANLRHERSTTAATVTASLGVAAMTPTTSDEGWAGLLAQADAALYEAKRTGRNRVSVLHRSQAMAE